MKKIALYLFLAYAYQTLSQEIVVPPYLQPGDVSSLNKEEKVLIWQTDSVAGSYTVEYVKGKFEAGVKPSLAKISSVKLFLKNKTSLLYRAHLSKLQFDELYSYRVVLTGKIIAENTFTSRSKQPASRFAVFGDCGHGNENQAAIAYQVHQQKPQFVLVTGDNVYYRGLEHEYRKSFFPYYTSPEASPEKGAPLMSSIPFYMVVGNHDIGGDDLDKHSGGLAYFYYSDLPLNAPIPESTLQVKGEAAKVKAFKKNTGARFPGMTNYSFDYGNVHIVCLDANVYVNPLDHLLKEWLVMDLQRSKADWKIVAYHHPAFNASKAHYDDQLMRLLAPVLEELRVDLVLTGHVHNYQRSVPLKFDPKKNKDGTMYVISKEGQVDGKFTLDSTFDGITNTKPNGIIYIVTGAGGAPLYDKQYTNNPALWKHDPPDNWAPFTVKMISDIHSFTMIETTKEKLILKQLDAKGNVFDEISVTK